jgi:two-component system, OmpR family, response regulator RstA
MALVALQPQQYTGAVSEHLHELSPAREVDVSAAPTAPPIHRVAVHCTDPGAAAGWSDALRAEGVAVEADRADLAAQALVLFCAPRVAEHLGTLRELRARDAALPLVVVCPALRELDQVLALEMGADDAIDARTGAAVVAARLRALWRRAGGAHAAAPHQLCFGRLSLHLRERRVQLGAERIELTECEFEVLWLLARQAGRAVSRTELLERLRGLPYQRIDRSIDCRIYRLRAKLGDGAAQRIRTVRNCGYLFSPARW